LASQELFRETENPPNSDSIRAQLQCVLSSPQFAGSARLSRFLVYCVEQAILQPGGQLKEYEIATEVFDRDGTFDPRLDPIVRVQAVRLRAKLKDYYHERGDNVAVRIGLPKGGYAARFEIPSEIPLPEVVTPEPLSIETQPEPVSNNGGPNRVAAVRAWQRSSRYLYLTAAMATIAIGFLVYWLKPSSSASAGRRSIAVVYFKDLSGAANSAWLSTALSEMLTTELGSGTGLRTIAGQNVARMRAELNLPSVDGFSKETLGLIRGNLGTDLVLVGTYLPVADSIRLDVYLQDTNSGETIESFSQTGDRSELLNMVSMVGARIRSQLGVAPHSATDESVLRASTPATPEGMRLYSEGLDRLRLFDAPSAQKLLQAAATADPNYPLVHAALSNAWSALGYDGRAVEEAKIALDLAGSLSREERLEVEGRYYEARSDWAGAMDVYHTLWGFFPYKMEYGLSLAAAETKGGQSAQALRVIASLHKLIPEGDARIDLAEATADAAVADYRQGLAAAERAEKAAQEHGARLLEANASIEKGNSLFHLTEPLKAREAYRRAAAICESVGDRGCRLAAINSEGGLVRNQGDLETANRLFQVGLSIAREIGDRRATSSILTNMGALARSRADLPQAKQLFEESLRISQDTGDKHAEAINLNDLANVLNNTGNPEAAREKYRECLDLARQIGDRSRIAIALGNLAILDYTEGNLSGARKGLEEAIALKRQIGDRVSYAYSLGHLSDVLELQGDLPGARRAMEEQCQINATAGAKVPAAQCQMGLAELNMKEGHPELAEKTGRKIAGDFTTVSPAAEAWRLVAMSNLQMGRLHVAHDAVEKAETIAQKSVNFENFRIPIAISKARIDGAMGRKAEAVRSLQENLALAKKLNKVGIQLHIRLILCQIQDPHGPKTVQLEEDARRMGYGLYAQEARKLLQAK
jgi:tetratricopeptide (TPR) repeat protein/TolB-like protein